MFQQCRVPLRAAVTCAAALALLTALVPGRATAQMNDNWVTIVLSEEPDQLDPCNSGQNQIGRIIRTNVVEPLTKINPDDGSITPRLAESWEKIDDKTWRFHLRQGVTFHDGSPFNAEAVAKAMSRTLDSDLFCTIADKAFGGLKLKGVPKGEHTIDIVGEKPIPILPTRMGELTIPSPNTSMASLVNDPVGTGPYVMGDWRAGEEITLTRNDSYWGDQPVVEGARYVFRSESSVRAAMVKVGEADIAPNIAEQEANDPEMDYSYLNSETTRLKLDTQIAPLNDRRVRLAMNYALDREAIRGSLLSKDVLLATQLVVPSILGHNHDLDKEARSYDPEMARMLIAEAKADGVPVDREITIIGRIGHYPNVSEVLEAAMGMFEAVGLNMKLQMREVSEWLDGFNKPYAEGRGPTIHSAQHDNNNGDPVFSVYFKYHCDGATSTLCDPMLDSLIEKATVLSGPERTATWREAFRRIHDDLVTEVWMYHMVGSSRVNPRVNYVPTIATNSEVLLEQISFNK